MRFAIACAALVAGASVLGSQDARAQDRKPKPSAADRAAAQVLFDEGVALMNKGQFAQACPKLAESQRLEPAVGTQFNLADCYEQIGRLASAWTHFIEVEQATQSLGQTARAQAARRRVDALVPRLAKLRIEVADPLPGLVITRNGSEVGSAQWGTAVPLDRGEYEVLAKAPGASECRRRAQLSTDGEVVTVSIPKLDDPRADELCRGVVSERPAKSVRVPVGITLTALGGGAR
jgi:tetratricopeptide (TPR) repeat protein